MWAEHLRPDGIAVQSMHLGWADTPGVRRSLPTFRRAIGPLLRSPEEGADTMVWLAADDGSPIATTGRFWLAGVRARSTGCPRRDVRIPLTSGAACGVGALNAHPDEGTRCDTHRCHKRGYPPPAKRPNVLTGGSALAQPRS